jgi:hypothetical protein
MIKADFSGVPTYLYADKHGRLKRKKSLKKSKNEINDFGVD